MRTLARYQRCLGIPTSVNQCIHRPGRPVLPVLTVETDHRGHRLAERRVVGEIRLERAVARGGAEAPNDEQRDEHEDAADACELRPTADLGSWTLARWSWGLTCRGAVVCVRIG
jgi:hypothetical protein